MSDSITQEHNSQGDNIAGNKYEENNYYSFPKETDSSITSKLNSFQQYNRLDFTDELVLKAFKESISDLIKEEQEKSHNIVPLGHIRNRFKSYIHDDFFAKAIQELSIENAITVNDVQVCYIPKDLNFRVNL